MTIQKKKINHKSTENKKNDNEKYYYKNKNKFFINIISRIVLIILYTINSEINHHIYLCNNSYFIFISKKGI